MNSNTVLGLDIGTNSLGWALFKQNTNGQIANFIDIGSRIFEAGMDGDISSGNAESKAKKRRDKRSIRRSIARRKRRMEKLKKALQQNNLLPDNAHFNESIEKLDEELLQKYSTETKTQMPSKEILSHTLPFYIRARALDMRLTPHELGRALYHLAQRRGFQSNRKETSNEDEGVVKQGISELREKIKEAGARTLGEYFAYINPTRERIRGLWTSRDMYIDEFNKVCDAQADSLSLELRKYLYNSIFFQRKLKNQKNLIGSCILEPNKKRCSWYRPEAQTFRLLQSINNLRVKLPDEPERELSSEEWPLLRDALEGISGKLDKNGNLTFAKAKTLLSLPRGSKFSVEEGGEKSLKGNAINAKLYGIFGERWKIFSEAEKEAVLMDIHSYEKDSALVLRAQNAWGLSKEKAEELANVRLPEEYCNLSLKAVSKLLPDMEEGLSYSEAVKKHYPEQFKADCKTFALLPQVSEFNDDLRNPAVHRCLSETRKIVNSIIAQYGKPDLIRIEVARDLKKSNKEKKNLIKKNRENEKQREAAKRKIFNELKIENPSRDDVLKVLLAEECGWKCPYTQKCISINSLLTEPQYDIEHIIPFSRCLDDSFANKTL
ncbi:MAG: type II CRISPR RNA-guided endonuclease Cas9, partial [Victivallales bacterium]